MRYPTTAVLAWAATIGPAATQQVPFAAQAGVDPRDGPARGNLQFPSAELEDFIEDVMDKWHAPGLAVAVIDGEHTWTKGFGHASLEPPTPVTPHTLFFTGSTTKSFTAAGLSLLIDNSSDYSNILWDTPLSKLLREDFVLSDDWATAHITIEDALCHRTGYPRHDMAIGNDPIETVRKLRHLPLSVEPRTILQYTNTMYAAAGVLISKLTSLELGKFFHEYLWTPMGMNETFLAPYDSLFKPSGLVLAESYIWNKRTKAFVKHSNQSIRGDEAAGAVISNVLDYAKYLRVMIAETGPISKAGHRELKRPRMFHDFNAEMFGPGPLFYGLGWMGSVFEGEQIYWHTGTVVPYVTFMVIVPSKEYGIVVTGNAWSKVRELVTYRILYDLLGVEEGRRRDFEKLFTEEEKAMEKHLATCQERLYPHTSNPPIPASVSLTSHAGHYRHAAYDNIFVALECDKETPSSDFPAPASEVEACRLSLARGPQSQAQVYGNLTHVTGDFWLTRVFEADVVEMTEACVRTQFRVDASGVVSAIGVDVRLEEETTPLVWFDRVQ